MSCGPYNMDIYDFGTDQSLRVDIGNDNEMDINESKEAYGDMPMTGKKAVVSGSGLATSGKVSSGKLIKNRDKREKKGKTRLVEEGTHEQVSTCCTHGDHLINIGMCQMTKHPTRYFKFSPIICSLCSLWILLLFFFILGLSVMSLPPRKGRPATILFLPGLIIFTLMRHLQAKQTAHGLVNLLLLLHLALLSLR